jgi:hypothetical protein
MRWIALLVPFLLFTAATCTDSATDSSDSDPQQTYYNGYLRVARQQLGETGGDLYCEPDYWYLVASQVEGADAGQRALMQSAMADACKEGGHLSGAAQYSPYYADAP